MRSSRLAFALLLAAACGGDAPPYTDLANICASPRAGTSDKKGTVDDEKKFLRAWIDALYLWYREVPNVDPNAWTTAVGYFDQLKTQAKTASGNFKDRFHFTIPTVEWEQQSQGGPSVGYGVSWAALGSKCATSGSNTCPPRDFRVAYTQPGSPAASLLRGAQIQSIDTVDFINGTDVVTLNAGLFPSTKGEQHHFVLKNPDGSTADVVLTADSVVETPVQNVHVIPNTHVGYMLFNDHIATAESALIDAVNNLKTQGATDLVLDIRYNGGGFLAIASELAYMIAGPARTSGKVFERLTFNDKYPNRDPVQDQPLTPTPFANATQGLSTASGIPLPHLDLPRVFILTSSGTCSASESVINGLMGVDVQVIQIGGLTCGKPYGFYPQDNCGTTYFSIEFKGVNAKGFGDYADGFIPGGGGSNPAGCPLMDASGRTLDDFGHALGDPAETLLATALSYAANSACPPRPPAAALTLGGLHAGGQVLKPEWRMNRIVQR